MRIRQNRSAVAVFSSAANLVALWFLASGTIHADELPRYKFVVGQQMIYRTTDPPRERTDADGTKTVTDSNSTWTITVVGCNADGSYRLVYQEVGLYLRTGGKQEIRKTRLDNGHFDVATDGKLLERDPPATDEPPYEMFPLLPPDEASLHSSWSEKLALDETTRTFTAAEPDRTKGDDWTIDEEVTDNHRLVEDQRSQRRFDFDLRRSLTRKTTLIGTDNARPDREAGTSTTVIELVEVRQLEPYELAAFNDETSRYFAAVARSTELTDLADTDVAHAREHLDQGEAILRELEGQFTLPSVQTMLATKLDELETSRTNTLRRGETLSKLIGRPSQPWTTTDLDGNPRTLEDYRGRIVVLDFWYRGCGWCITAMPQIKQLVDDFRDQPVIVLGMNHDAKVENARVVVDKLKLNYVSLRDGEDESAISKKYSIGGWPTLVILDGDGVIRHFHVGYTPTMRKQLGERIRELLAENQAARSRP